MQLSLINNESVNLLLQQKEILKKLYEEKFDRAFESIEKISFTNLT